MRLTVKDIAKALGLSNETIRYYVDEGLIHPVKNPDNNYWEYSSDDLIRLTDIMFYRSQGLGINEIRHIMNGLDLEDFDEVLEERKSQLIDEMHSLSRRLWSLDDWIKPRIEPNELAGMTNKHGEVEGDYKIDVPDDVRWAFISWNV